ncbi:hypothetical protein G7076_04960 [Sphingomonas sp. HDW15A]|uniref:hypothetical protein n=1 Tax=Sphingomonas sp. HDW15A TaxID=2714942 RepID=UPI00140B48A7|nr:hypothetical protein [Sphingomonas sp. HDW15A]QIK95904.1 hypothetical protein G7076_04960 [Sphingomonas sp. HDW15A]
MFRLIRVKPPNGWNAVGWELVIVTAGVLIALGAQELAQRQHWKLEVRETRNALDAELARDLAAFEYRLSQRRCVDDRLAELSEWGESLEAGSPLKLKSPVPGVPGFTVRTAVWELTDGEIAARIPLEARLNYAWLYDALKTFDELRDVEGDAWEALAAYGGSSRLDEADLRAMKTAIGKAEAVNAILQGVKLSLDKYSRELSVHPESNIERRSDKIIAEWNRELCQPLL